MEDKNYTKKIYFVLIFFAIILTFFLCKVLSSVLLPIIFALFLSFILYPIIKKLKEKTKIPWAVSTIILVVATLIILIALTSLLISSLTTIANEYPKYETKFMTIYKWIAGIFDLKVDEGQSFINNIWQYFKVREYIQKAAISLSTGVISIGKTLFTVFLLLAFLLLEMQFTHEKLDAAFPGEETNSKVKSITKRILSEIVRFTSIKAIVSLATGILVYLMAICFDLDFPIVWAFLAFVMNFIPIFGSVISCLLTALFSLIQFFPEGIGKSIAILGIMILINFTIGNIIEPRIEGKQLGISPFVILVSLSVWGYIWGFAGMIFAVPIMVSLKIICENIEYLKPIAIFLGGKVKKK